MSVTNAYNTTDPARLLQLKREEAQAMLRIVRAITPDVEADELIQMVVDTIQNQLDVRRLMLVTNIDNAKQLAICKQFDRLTTEEMNLLEAHTAITPVSKALTPLFKQKGVEYIIPVGQSPAPLGWFLIAEFAESESETENDLVFIETVGSILVTALLNRQLFEARMAQKALQKEMEIAARIQKQSLPTSFDLHPLLDIHAVNVAHFQVGGDFFDLLRLGDDELFICIADVSGKGYGAALLVANLQSNLRSLIQTGATYRQMIEQLEQAVKHLTHGEHFVTIFLGKIDLSRQIIEYVNAGHNPPLLLRGAETVELTQGCIPIGILNVPEIEIGRESFEPDDLLFLFTDGVVEQTDRNDNQLGSEVLADILRQTKNKPANEVGRQMLELVNAHAGKEHFEDDLSFVVVRFAEYAQDGGHS